MKIVPTITCVPCRPVVAQKAEPYAESAKENPASIYSRYWKLVKTLAINTVKIIPDINPYLWFAINE